MGKLINSYKVKAGGVLPSPKASNSTKSGVAPNGVHAVGVAGRPPTGNVKPRGDTVAGTPLPNMSKSNPPGGTLPKRGMSTIPAAGGHGGGAHKTTPKSPGTDIGGAKQGGGKGSMVGKGNGSAASGAHSTMTAQTGSHGYSQEQAIAAINTLHGK